MNYILFSVIKVHLIIQLPNGQDDFEIDEKIFKINHDPGRSVTETTTEHIEEVRCLIDLTIDEIQVETGINCGIIERIISEHPRRFNPTTGPTQIRSDFMRISVKPMNSCRNPGNDPTSDP